MFRAFFSALINLSASVNALADTFTEANKNLRDRLALDYTEEMPALPASEDTPAKRNGRKAAAS